MSKNETVAFISKWYDARTNAYIEWCFGDGREVAHDLAVATRTRAGTRLLDVGCNIGNTSFYLAREFNCAVVGIDASRAAGFAAIIKQDRGEEFRQHIAECYAAFVAVDPAEIQRRFGISNHDYFIYRFGLTRDVILAHDVIWGWIAAQKSETQRIEDRE